MFYVSIFFNSENNFDSKEVFDSCKRKDFSVSVQFYREKYFPKIETEKSWDEVQTFLKKETITIETNIMHKWKCAFKPKSFIERTSSFYGFKFLLKIFLLDVPN